MKETYQNLNSEINLWGPDGNLQLEKDKEAARAYFLEHVNPNTVFFHSLKEKTDHLIENGLWDRDVVLKYGFDEFKKLMQHAYAFKFRFPTYLGAFKFYSSYALRNEDGTRYLERFEDRVVLTALAYSEDLEHAKNVITEIIEGRFQPATPTFLNAGRANAGGPVSCFILRVEDNMESISRMVTDSLQLSKRGGGVGIALTNIRESGSPIKKFEGQASGVIPIMKMLEDAFSYANQLGQRQGAGAVYLNAHHPDIMRFLDTKRENADEKIRIKTLSLGVVVPDITFELARENRDMYLFSPYDVERVYGKPFSDISVTEHYNDLVNDERIRKTKVNARKFFQTLAEIQFESGYPYIMFEDTVNRANPAPNVGRIVSSNLCSEIMQPQVASTFKENGEFAEEGQDISCNLGSLNIAKMQQLPNQDEFSHAVRVAYKFLNRVAKVTEMESSPSVIKGNNLARAIGLGQMNLHGWLISEGIPYDSEEARERFRAYMHDVTYFLIGASIDQVQIDGRFGNFSGSRWEDGSMIDALAEESKKVNPEYSRVRSPFTEDLADHWNGLKWEIKNDGMANQHLQAIPPTGSISYINNSTASIHPVTAPIEIRKEGKVGRVYYPAYGLTSENISDVKTAYEIGPNPIIDMYAVASPWVDQGLSLTLFFRDTATTRDINRAQVRAHKSGVKSIYYIRLVQKALTGTQVDECVSCML